MTVGVKFSQELADRICDDLAKGMTLKEVCRQDGMPSHVAVIHWKREDEVFGEQYRRAREAGYEIMADELLEIADNGTNDWMERRRADGTIEVVADHEHVGRSRLRLDTRKWLLAKALPKIYGDKLQHANAAGDSDATVVVHNIYSWQDEPEPKPE